MNTLKINNGNIYNVISIKEVHYTRAKRGTIKRHLEGIKDENWLLHYIDYHIKAKHPSEDYTRTFVYTETEFKNLPNY